MRLFIFGYGYSAAAAVARLRSRFQWIGATTRSEDKARLMRQDGIEPYYFDGTAPTRDAADAIRTASHILVTIAPGDDGDPVLRHHSVDLAIGRKPSAVAYLSTVGVYGDHGGRWVDERTKCKPVSPRSVARVEAEEGWRRFAEALGVPTSILRLSGIYGPGRNALLNLRDGTAKRLIKPGQVFNRIHVADIAQAAEESLFQRADGIFNITDDEPAPPQDVVTYAARLMQMEPPSEQDFGTAQLSEMARSFYSENKRVSNSKSKRELGMNYIFPNYRTALDHMWHEQKF